MRKVDEKLRVARGEAPCDMLFTNARIVNVLSGEIHPGSLAIHDGRIVGFGDYEARGVVDLAGSYIAPGLIDAHIHVESTMLTFSEFSRAVVPHGTVAAVVDPHEIANVLGLDGIRYVLDSVKGLPLDFFVMLPSCVPATPLETAGAELRSEDLALLIHEERVAGIGEMMNYPAVFQGGKEELKKIEVGERKQVDGHAPGLTGMNLNAYAMAGIRSDHESTSLAEAQEKLRLGLHVHMREGSSERNLAELLPLVNPQNAMSLSFATDDKHASDLVHEGHIDHSVRMALEHGVDPVVALQIATISTARHYNLRNLGALMPRYWADFIIFDSLDDFRVRQVYKKGHLVAEDGEVLFPTPADRKVHLRSTINMGEMNGDRLKVPAEGKNIQVIEIVPQQIVTRGLVSVATIEDGHVVQDTARDLLKLAVIERHSASGNVGVGFVKGFGLQQGALAGTVAHDAHNVISVGTNDADMLAAAKALERLKGGLVVVADGEVLESISLPLAGLMSDLPLEQVMEREAALKVAAKSLGCVLEEPFMTLSFLSLTPIPSLKVSDLGLVDVEKFEVVSLFDV